MDVVRYSQELITQLALFGKGMHRHFVGKDNGPLPKGTIRHPCHLSTLNVSLTLTCRTFAKTTCGKFRNELKEEREVDAVAKLLSTNNAAERPFAVAKAYLNIYGKMKLSNLAQFSLAMCNGSHRLAGPKGKQVRTKDRLVEPAGMELTCDARLQATVTKLWCTMRRAKYGRRQIGLKPGSISELLAADFESDKKKPMNGVLLKKFKKRPKWRRNIKPKQ